MTRDRIVIGAIGLLSAVAHGTMTLLRFHQMRISSWDNAIFEQVIASYARFEAPVSDAKAPGYMILGDHWSPIDALVAPLYRLFPSAQTVLLAQVALVTISVVIITSLAIRVMGTARGALVGVVYTLSFGIQSAVRSDFHEVAFALPLLAMAGAAYVDRRYTAVIWWSVPLVLVKEDLGATVAMVGVVLWLAGERRRGTIVAVGGLLAAILTTAVLIPSLSNVDGTYAYVSQIGNDRGVLEVLVDQADLKITAVFVTLVVTGFLALRSPWVLLVLPTFAWRFLGDNENYWGVAYHYSMVLMPIVFVAMIDGFKRVEGRRTAIPFAVASVFAVAAFLYPPSSPVGDLLRPSTWEDPPRAQAARDAAATIPEGVAVESDISLLKHLVTDRTAYWNGSIDLGAEKVSPEYVVFDLAAGLGSPPDPLAYAQSRYAGDWRTIFDRDGFVVVTRDDR